MLFGAQRLKEADFFMIVCKNIKEQHLKSVQRQVYAGNVVD